MFSKKKKNNNSRKRKQRRKKKEWYQQRIDTSPVRGKNKAFSKNSDAMPLASQSAGNIEEETTTVTKYVRKNSEKYPNVFYVVFIFKKEIPGLKTVELSGTFTLWRLVKMKRVEDVKRGIYYHTTLQVPEGNHHYRFTVQIEKKEGAQVWMEEHIVIDNDYPFEEKDDFDDPSNVLILDLSKNMNLRKLKEYFSGKESMIGSLSTDGNSERGDNQEESRMLLQLRNLKWVVPKSKLIERMELTSFSGRNPSRLPNSMVGVMQEYKKMNLHKENVLEKKRLAKLKAKSPYLYSMEMDKKRKKRLAQLKRQKGVNAFTTPSPIVYGILPCSHRGQEILHGVKSTYTLRNIKVDDSKHIPKRYNNARLIGTMEKCPALSVFEIEERVGNILKESRSVAAMMPEHYKKPKSKYAPTSSTIRRRGEDKPYIQPEEIMYGIF
jgi:hypothetical protein